MAGFRLAILAGIFAALASVTSKLAFEPDGSTLKTLTCGFLSEDHCSKAVMALRGSSFLLMLLCNAQMWTLFARSLRASRSTVEATVANNGANFFFTAVFGVFLFGESLPVLWWCGASVVLAGLVMIHHGARLPGTGTEQRFDDIPLEGTDRLANPTGGTDEWQKKME